MIRAFSPALGQFRGVGQLHDGTELRCRFSGQEVISGVCYGLRLEVMDSENDTKLMDIYFVVSQDAGEHLEIQYFDSREHLHSLRVVSPPSGGRPSGHVFSFEGSRTNGTAIRFHFGLVSSERIDISMESNSAKDTHMEERCSMKFERVHERIITVVNAA